jgi:hypothetical protein
MSEGFRRTAFKRRDEPAQIEHDITKCGAYGCKCRATVNNGMGWLCFAHAFAMPDRWQHITRELHEHDWLLSLVADVRRMDAAHQDWRGFASQFWANADRFCMPQPFENAGPYVDRMLMELLHRIGERKNRPAPREPQKVKPSGRFANSQKVEA